MDIQGYVSLWCNGSPDGWVLHHLMPVLMAAGATRLTTYIFKPRR